MDRILKNWFENGLRTPADVAKAKQERSVASQQNIAKSENKHKKKTSYNIDEVLRKNEETELVYKRKGDNV